MAAARKEIGWALYAVFAAMMTAAAAVLIEDVDREETWIVSVVEMPGPPGGTAQVHPVNATTLQQHPVIWNLTQELRVSSRGVPHIETEGAEARRILLEFAAALGEEDPRFLKVRFLYEGGYYEVSADQPQA